MESNLDLSNNKVSDLLNDLFMEKDIARSFKILNYLSLCLFIIIFSSLTYNLIYNNQSYSNYISELFYIFIAFFIAFELSFTMHYDYQLIKKKYGKYNKNYLLLNKYMGYFFYLLFVIFSISYASINFKGLKESDENPIRKTGMIFDLLLSRQLRIRTI